MSTEKKTPVARAYFCINQKGGAGKTTVAQILASHLSAVYKHPVVILDTDQQASAYNLIQQFLSRKKKEGIDKPATLYQVKKISYHPIADLKSVIKAITDQGASVIVDCPGNLSDSKVAELCTFTDGVYIVPFHYFKKDFLSGYTMASLIREVNPKVRIVAVPNKIHPTAKFVAKQIVHETWESLGMEITKKINDNPAKIALIEDHPDKYGIALKNIFAPVADQIIEFQ